MQKRLCFLIFIYFSSQVFAQDSLRVPKMTFSEMNLGLQFRNAAINSNGIENANFGGVFGSIQHSFLFTIFKHKFENKRIIFGDLISGQLTAGYLQSTKPLDFKGLWATYYFGLGAGCVFRINKHNDIGLNLKILSFGKEITTSFFSGSSIKFRYRFKSILAELDFASPSILYFGWTRGLTSYTDAKQIEFTIKYLYTNRFQIGLQSIFLPVFSERKTDFGTEKIWHIKLFWGSYF